MKTQLLISIFLFVAINSFGQSVHKLKGRVTDSGSKQAMEYATLYLEQTEGNFTAGEITDHKGKFQFADVPEGNYRLTIHFIGYEKQEIEFSFSGNKRPDLENIRMKPSISQLDGPTISAEQNAVDIHVDKQVVNVSEQLAASGGTAADALQAVPSVQVDAEGNVSLRGSSDFMLLVDGRPSVIKAEDLLSQMQAATIQRIEVITNPSAKYEAEGNTGIINIITKKDYLKGTESLVNLMLANGKKYSADVMVNKRFGKFRAFAGYRYSDKTKVNTSITQRQVFTDDTLQETFDSQREIRRYVSEFNLGADYFMKENTSLSVNAQLGEWKFDRTIPSLYSSSAFEGAIESEEKYSNGNKYFTGGLNLDHTFNDENHQVVFDAFASFINNAALTHYTEYEPAEEFTINNNADKTQIRTKLDYTGKLSEKMKLEAGLFFDVNQSTYDYYIDDMVNGIGSGQVDSSKINMDYSNAVPAAYATLSSSVGGLNLQAGLRSEATIRKLSANAENHDYESLDFFPSLHLSKTIAEKHTFTLGVSRRINRPTEWQLSPLVYSSDQFMQRQGNPELVPEFTYAAELGHYFRNDKWNINSQLFYRNIKNSISSYLINTGNEFVETYDNLDRSTNSGVEFMMSYSPLKWLQLRMAASAYYASYSGTLADGNPIDNNTFVMNGNFNSTFKISKTTRLQFLAVYYAPSKTQQGEIESFYYFDFILRQQCCNNKLNFTLRTHNTFDTGLLIYTEEGPEYFSKTNYRYEGPTFIFSISYKLNNFRMRQNEGKHIPDFDSGLDH